MEKNELKIQFIIVVLSPNSTVDIELKMDENTTPRSVSSLLVIITYARQ